MEKLNARLISSAERGNLNIVKKMLEKGADIHAQDDEALITSTRKGHFNIVKYLVESGADIHAGIDRALIISAIGGHLDIVKYLVDNGAHVTARDNEALKYSAMMGFLEIVKYLIDNGADSLILQVLGIGTIDVVAYLKTLHFNKPYERINSTCSTEKLSDGNITKIGKKLGLTNTNKATLCKDIANYFQKAADYMRDNVSKCITESVLSGDAIGDIHPLFFTMYQQGNHMHCGDIRELIRLDKNPENRIPFTDEQINTFKKKMNILQSFINNLDDEEEIVMSVSGLVKNAALNFINLLRYPNPIDLYVNASDELIKNFILELQEMDVLTNSDVNSLNSVNISSTKKITLANVLADKLKNASDINYINGTGISTVSVTLEEVYNNIFKI